MEALTLNVSPSEVSIAAINILHDPIAARDRRQRVNIADALYPERETRPFPVIHGKVFLPSAAANGKSLAPIY